VTFDNTKKQSHVMFKEVQRSYVRPHDIWTYQTYIQRTATTNLCGAHLGTNMFLVQYSDNVYTMYYTSLHENKV